MRDSILVPIVRRHVLTWTASGSWRAPACALFVIVGLTGCGGTGGSTVTSDAAIDQATAHIHFHVRIPRRLPNGYSFGFAGGSANGDAGGDNVALFYSNSDKVSFFVREYGPGLSPSIAEPQTGVVRVGGVAWKTYSEHVALVHTYPDGVTVSIEGSGLLPQSALEVVARGIR